MICENCGHNHFRSELVDRAFHVDGQLILVENIPAETCERCGEFNFNAEVGERLRTLVRQPHQPARVIQAEVLRYEAA